MSTGCSASGRSPRRAPRPPRGRRDRNDRRDHDGDRPPTITPARRRRLTRLGALPLASAVREDEVEVVLRRAAAHARSVAGKAAPPPGASVKPTAHARRALAARGAGRSPHVRPTSRRRPAPHERSSPSSAASSVTSDLLAVGRERGDSAPQVASAGTCTVASRNRLGVPDRRVADRLRRELLVRDDEPVVVARAQPGVGEADLLDDAP